MNVDQRLSDRSPISRSWRQRNAKWASWRCRKAIWNFRWRNFRCQDLVDDVNHDFCIFLSFLMIFNHDLTIYYAYFTIFQPLHNWHNWPLNLARIHVISFYSDLVSHWDAGVVWWILVDPIDDPLAIQGTRSVRGTRTDQSERSGAAWWRAAGRNRGTTGYQSRYHLMMNIWIYMDLYEWSPRKWYPLKYVKSWYLVRLVLWNLFFPYIGNHDPNWVMFSRGVGRNHQPVIVIICYIYL